MSKHRGQRQFAINAPLIASVAAAFAFAAGCGPEKPQFVTQPPPAGLPQTWSGRTLYQTASAYIYARDEESAAEADRWVREAAKYVTKKHERELGRGLVVVQSPADAPLVRSLDDQMSLEQDPELMVTRPRKSLTVDETRAKLAEQGIPEEPMIRGTAVPLSRKKLAELGLQSADSTWALAAPSHDQAVACGVEVTAAALHHKKPEMSLERCREAARMLPKLSALPFEMSRGNAAFVMWVQRQSDWSDDQRREAIRAYLRDSMRDQGLPAPKDEDLDW